MAKFCTGLTAALFALSLVLFPQAGAEAARTGLTLCGQVILPALFPYFVLSNLAVRLGLGQWLGRLLGPVMGPLFHVSGTGGAPLALGLLGGYPVGAGTVRSLLDQGLCDREEAQSLLRFCNNSGPAFILAVAGSSVFGSIRIGFLLLAVHVLSALAVGILLRGPARPRAVHNAFSAASVSPGAAFTQSVRQALSSSLQVSAYVVLFNVVIGLLRAIRPDTLALPGPLAALLTGLLELSNGICALKGCDPGAGLAVCGFLLGWGGVSVHCQTAALLEGSGLGLGPYLRAKALQGVLSAGLLWLLAPLCSHWAAAGSGGQLVELTALFPHSLAAGAILWGMIVLLLTNSAGKRTEKEL